MEKSDLVTIEKISKEFFKKLGIDGQVECDQENDHFTVNLSSPEPAVVIGYHGQTLASLQLILSLIIAKKMSHFCKIALDISDWRKRREEVLKQIAQQLASKVAVSKQPETITGLKAFERRIVHLALADSKLVTTTSEGEDDDRNLIVTPKLQ